MRRKIASSRPTISFSTASCISAMAPKKKTIKRVMRNNTVSSTATSRKARSSIYRGVTRHRWTGRYEAHLWDKESWNMIQNKKGKQVYLGAYDNEDDAARTYDLAALKYWGPPAVLNFPVERYGDELVKMQNMAKEEYLASLRRRSNGFSRGVSRFRGVARHHQNGRWEARIGRVSGNKYLYLGTYDTQEEAAAAYDRAAIRFRGPGAVTNFDISNYAEGRLPEVKEEVIPTPANDEEATAVKLDQLTIAEQQPTIPKVEPVAPVDVQPMEVMDLTQTEEHEHPFDMCLDTGYNSFPIPDIPFENTADLAGFDNKGFDDDIEFIFDESVDAAFMEDADVKGANVSKEASASPTLSPVSNEASTSPTLSPVSTISSVGSDD